VKHRHTILMLGWAWCGFHKKHIGTCNAKHVFLHPVVTAGHVVHSSGSGHKTSTHYYFWGVGIICHARVGPRRFPKKARRDTLHRTYLFAFGGICGSCSAFRCAQGTKRRRTIFHTRIGPSLFTLKVRRDTLRRTCVFASGGSYGSRSTFHCVRARNIDALFFMLG
jgi:hypothetical protein